LINTAKWENYADRHRGAIFALAGGFAGIVQAWHSRGFLSPDLLNYLSLARTLLANGWSTSINGFWSPLYSWLLAIPMSLHLVTNQTELLWVHAVNLGIFFAAMLCFHVFMNHTLRLAALRAGSNYGGWQRIESLWYFTGCAIFLFAVLEWLPNSLCTPDLLVASFILLSAGFLAAILCRDRSWPNYIVLGQALALGYLAKAPAFPLAVLFFVMLFFLSHGEKWRWAKCLACVAAFAVIAGPFLYTLSKKEAHLTFGESGRVNFLMYGDGLPAYWLGEGIQAQGTAPRYETLCTDPPVYAFRQVPTGVYYPAIEPSNWYAGLVPHLAFRQEAQNLKDGFHSLGEMAEAESDLFLGIVLLLLLSGVAAGLKSVLNWWFLWLPAVCGIAMFWLVHVEDRFIAPFVVLGFVGLYSGVLVSSSRRPRLARTILLAILLLQGCRASIVIAKGFLGTSQSSTSAAAKIITDLTDAGVPPRAKIALIGNPLGAYWAWMGQYLIVGELPASGVPKFLGESPGERVQVYACLSKSGAQAALIHIDTPELLGSGWQKMGPGDLYLKVLTNGEPQGVSGQGLDHQTAEGSIPPR
jgi:hypothetical protein